MVISDMPLMQFLNARPKLFHEAFTHSLLGEQRNISNKVTLPEETPQVTCVSMWGSTKSTGTLRR